jgi:hypothetical protein
MGLDVVILDIAALRAPAPVQRDKCALSGVAPPDLALVERKPV